MKINGTFVLHEVGNDYILVPSGKGGGFDGICALNETGAFIWKKLTSFVSEDELIDEVCRRYSVERERARKDLSAFLRRLSAINIIEDESRETLCLTGDAGK